MRHKLSLLRDASSGPKKFRELARELAMLLCYEATRDLDLVQALVTTPISVARGETLRTQVGLIPILRAGLGMLAGAHELIPTAQVWHIGLYRDERTLRPVAYYSNLPVEPSVQVSLVLDPMLATGGSAVAAVDLLKRWGSPRIKFVGLLAAPAGVARLTAAHPDLDVHLAAIDERLNELGYIVPGLGDAGDRLFGTG